MRGPTPNPPKGGFNSQLFFKAVFLFGELVLLRFFFRDLDTSDSEWNSDHPDIGGDLADIAIECEVQGIFL